MKTPPSSSGMSASLDETRQHGFSLIELIITITLIGILASVAVPSYRDTVEKNRLNAALQSLKGDLQLARSESIKRSSVVTLSTSSGASGSWCYGLTESSTGCDCSQPSSGSNFCEIRRVLGSDHESTSLTSSMNISFDSRRSATTATSLGVTSANHSAQINVNSAGLSRVCGGDLYAAC